MMRTHGAGTLRAEHAGSLVTLAGWVARRRDHGGVAFVDLRDASGVVQVVVRDEMLAASGAHDLRNEYCLAITGEVSLRPEGNANPDLATGEVEVVTSKLEVLSPSAPLPFQIDERVTIGEEVRLKYRYLDLRRPGPAAALRLRSEVNRVARTVLAERGFVEIETPTMTRSTPEGARDFLVPARLRPGSWYALPQSPAAVQAAAHGGRDGAVLPDRPVLPRRGLPGRPAAGVHPARHRDELRRAGRRHRTDRGADPGHLGIGRGRGAHPDPAADLRRGHGSLRHRQAGPAVRAGADRADRLLPGHSVPGLPGRLRRRGGDARRSEPAAQAARRVAGVRQTARTPRVGVRARRRGRRARRTGGQEPVRDRTRRSGRRCGG